MNLDRDKLVNLHKFGLNGILDVVFKRGTFKKWPFIFSVLLSLLGCIIIFMQHGNISYNVLKQTTDLVLAVFPNLLGFSLGGYAIAVGFSNVDLIKQSTNIDKHSIYQSLNAIFALSILFQALAVIAGFFISWAIKISTTSIIQNDTAVNFGNVLLLFVLFLASLYSLLLTPFVVTNLFTLSQLSNLHYTIEQAKEKKEETPI